MLSQKGSLDICRGETPAQNQATRAAPPKAEYSGENRTLFRSLFGQGSQRIGIHNWRVAAGSSKM